MQTHSYRKSGTGYLMWWDTDGLENWKLLFDEDISRTLHLPLKLCSLSSDYWIYHMRNMTRKFWYLITVLNTAVTVLLLKLNVCTFFKLPITCCSHSCPRTDWWKHKWQVSTSLTLLCSILPALEVFPPAYFTAYSRVRFDLTLNVNLNLNSFDSVEKEMHCLNRWDRGVNGGQVQPKEKQVLTLLTYRALQLSIQRWTHLRAPALTLHRLHRPYSRGPANRTWPCLQTCRTRAPSCPCERIAVCECSYKGCILRTKIHSLLSKWGHSGVSSLC